MNDLISRQAAINTVFSMCCRWNTSDSEDLKNMLMTAFQDLPSAEPEIIHCRECKYAHLTYDGDCKQCDHWLDDDDFLLTLYLDGDFYCGYAERKDDA